MTANSQINPTHDPKAGSPPEWSSLRVERWRVITSATGGGKPIADAAIRLCDESGRGVLAAGEARDAPRALEAALGDVALEASKHDHPISEGAYRRLLSECGLLHKSNSEATTRLVLSAIHESAMLSRLAVLTNTHDVSDFQYHVSADGLTANIDLTVSGGTWQAERLASRCRRVVGVWHVSRG
jgi:hypothetical protein